MLTSKFARQRAFENNILRSCFILIVAMPALAASLTTVVKTDLKTGRLVRSMAAPVSHRQVSNPEIAQLIDHISAEQGVERQLVHSVIRAESNYNQAAVSPKGAQGLMQLIPSTARRFGVNDAFDPDENIRGGVRYLRFLLDYYQGDYVKTIAAYNAGEGAVDKYNGVPPYAETRKYVYRVARNLDAARQSEPVAVAVSPALSTAANSARMETARPIETSTDADGRVFYRTP
jgi:soluble lytic murein transglycosylase-like protein